jgi:hypothetical protein
MFTLSWSYYRTTYTKSFETEDYMRDTLHNLLRNRDVTDILISRA